jgi:hypothetical protein
MWVGTAGRDIWREALRTCVAHLGVITSSGETVGQLLGVDDCKDQRIFFSGMNVEEATIHDSDVIAANPALMSLHYASTVEKAVTRPSYLTIPQCAGQDTSVSECDEYPFLTTEEGYGGANLHDYRSINGDDNGLQGAFLSAFVSYCPVLKSSARFSDDRNYLVIADMDLPATFGYCPL